MDRKTKTAPHARMGAIYKAAERESIIESGLDFLMNGQEPARGLKMAPGLHPPRSLHPFVWLVRIANPQHYWEFGRIFLDRARIFRLEFPRQRSIHRADRGLSGPVLIQKPSRTVHLILQHPHSFTVSGSLPIGHHYPGGTVCLISIVGISFGRAAWD